jgi:SAM-dependent methyltransferase
MAVVTPIDDQALEHARRFAQHVAPTLLNVARRAVDLAVVDAGNSVLDLGTATGLGAFLAAERAGRDGSVIGMDASEAFLEIARDRSTSVGYDYIHWRQGLPPPLPFADESFDAVLCLHGLHFAANPFALLEEVRRVLVEDGRFVATLWSGRAGNEWIELLEGALRRGAPGARPPASLALTQPGNLEALLQSVGFIDIETARAPDRMRFQGATAFWEWARAIAPWDAVLAALSETERQRARSALETVVEPRLREGELAIGREIVYARAVSPEAP